jgi:KipI family sensor histidine kinase inhibitor
VPVRLLPYGPLAWLVELDELPAVLGYAAALRAGRLDGVAEVVPAARTVLVHLDPAALAAGVTTRERVAAALEALPYDPAAAPPDRAVDVPVTYDGADLDEVAALTGLSPAEVVERHSAPDYVVAFSGFVPGFAYCTGGDPRLRVPRLDTPRTRVPAGSVAIADAWTGVYPRASPGGWRLLGRTDAVLWDVHRDPPALLAPGTRVRFRPRAAS